MSDPTRRTLLAGAMIVSATAAAAAQDLNPIEGNKGGTILGPRDPSRAAENPDLLIASNFATINIRSAIEFYSSSLVGRVA